MPAPPPGQPCQACGGKWLAEGGGLCGVCRALDRLTATVRGPLLPAATGVEILSRIRGWTGEVQDIGELCRGVVPNPLGLLNKPPPPTDTVNLLLPQTERRGPPAPPLLIQPGTSALPLGPEHQAFPKSIPGASATAGHLSPPEPAHPPKTPVKEEVSPGSARDRRRRAKDRSRSRKRSRKDSKAARSRERPNPPAEAEEEPAEALASPVHPAGSGVADREAPEEAEDDESFVEEESAEEDRHRREPSRERSPRDERGRGKGPPRGHHRPRPPNEPPPGHGRHYGKNKGVQKRERERQYQERQRRQWGRRPPWPRR